MDDKSLKISLLQLENILRLESKRSTIATQFIKLSKKRKELKNQAKIFFKKIFRKKAEPLTEQLKVLVHQRGGIGDLCMLRIFIQKLSELLPLSEIYVCYDDSAIYKLIFPDNLSTGFVKKGYIPTDYDILLSGAHVLIYKHINYERIKTLAPSFLPILEMGLERSRMFKIIDDNTPHLDGYLAGIATAAGCARVSILGYSAGFELSQNERAPIPLDKDVFNCLEKFGLKDKKYITVHNGINTNTTIKDGFLTRTWPTDKWREFVILFKKTYPEISVVQIGGGKAEIFDFVDICLIGKTSIQELPYILEKSLLHIDGESGMVQLANLTSVKSIVLFGPTPIDYFAYERNTNLVSDFCTNCMNIHKYWASKCILGYGKDGYCLANISVKNVLDKVEQYLR